jgi:hypothetical protein
MESTKGRLGYLTIEESNILEAFREQLQKEYPSLFVKSRHDDHLLLRFLRSRKFDIGKSKLKWMKCEVWRKEFGCNDVNCVDQDP